MADAPDETEGIDERELVQKKGWVDLVYSFLASGVMTVSSPSDSFGILHPFFLARSVFLPDHLLCPTVWKIPCSRMVVVIHPQSIIRWPG